MYELRKFFFEQLSASAVSGNDNLSILLQQFSNNGNTSRCMAQSPVKRSDNNPFLFYHSPKIDNDLPSFLRRARVGCYFCLMTKRKLQRFAENQTFSNVFQPKSKYPFQDYELKGKWNKEYFKNDNPIVLELGCGRGEYTTQLSEKYPYKNFIGIDIKGAR